MKALVAAQGRTWDPGLVTGLAGLYAFADDGQDPVAAAERAFGSANALREAMEAWRGWEDGLGLLDSLTGGLAYLHEAEVPEALAGLGTERLLLLERLRDADLLGAPHQWPSLAEAVATFRHRYASAYLEHHDAYHASLTLLGHRLAEVRMAARALERLNDIEELGEPVEPELPKLVEELLPKMAACTAKPTQDAIERSPRCLKCAVPLGATAPATDVSSLVSYVHQALHVQNQRLSSSVVHRLLRGERTDRMDRFAKVVEVSDLSGLAAVLDDELESFLRALLQEQHAA